MNIHKILNDAFLSGVIRTRTVDTYLHFKIHNNTHGLPTYICYKIQSQTTAVFKLKINRVLLQSIENIFLAQYVSIKKDTVRFCFVHRVWNEKLLQLQSAETKFPFS